MSKVRTELLNAVAQKMVVVEVLQKRPSTAVKARLKVGSMIFVGTGFSKVKWPDDWNEDFGLQLATDKAASDITKQILKLNSVREFAGLLPIELEGATNV